MLARTDREVIRILGMPGGTPGKMCDFHVRRGNRHLVEDHGQSLKDPKYNLGRKRDESVANHMGAISNLFQR